MLVCGWTGAWQSLSRGDWSSYRRKAASSMSGLKDARCCHGSLTFLETSSEPGVSDRFAVSHGGRNRPLPRRGAARAGYARARRRRSAPQARTRVLERLRVRRLRPTAVRTPAEHYVSGRAPRCRSGDSLGLACRQGLEGLARTGCRRRSTLVMKGSVVRIRASALPELQGKHAVPEVFIGEAFWNTSLQMRVPNRGAAMTAPGG